MSAGQDCSYGRNIAGLGEGRRNEKKGSSRRNNVQFALFKASIFQRSRLLLNCMLRTADRVRFPDCHQEQ